MLQKRISLERQKKEKEIHIIIFARARACPYVHAHRRIEKRKKIFFYSVLPYTYSQNTNPADKYVSTNS